MSFDLAGFRPSLSRLIWSRRVWMGLAVFTAMMGSGVLIVTANGGDGISAVRHAAQIQFMHAMSTFACATFMNVGARGAQHAPAWFLSGSFIFALPAYAPGLEVIGSSARVAGSLLLLMGWVVLAASLGGVDRASGND